MKHRVNYDHVAPNYDRRYAVSMCEGVEAALLTLAQSMHGGRVLEVGCGTCHWLARLGGASQELFGLDLFAGMLNQAQNRNAHMGLLCGRAGLLPYRSSSFDLLYCVNAIHHFTYPRKFVSEAFRVLQPGGALAIIGSDSYHRHNSWYVYHYFDGTFETDQKRFPGWDSVSEWMMADGFTDLDKRQVERIQDPKYGRQVLGDPFLRKDSCSQLMLLTDEAYQAGLGRIEADLTEAETRGETLIFQSDISLAMLTGHRPEL